MRRYLEDAVPLDAVRGFAEGNDDVAAKLHEGLAELGVHLALLPEAQGGLGLGVLEAALVQEMLGRHTAPSAYAAAYGMGVVGVREAADAAQAGEWLSRLASGEVVLGVGMTEAVGAREDAGLRINNGLTGRASFVIGDALTTHFLLTTPDSFVIVARDAKGITETPLTTIDKTRVVMMLDFDNTEAETLTGGDAATARARTLAAGRVLLAADTLGAASVMLEKAVAYAAEREQFGRPIARFQAVKHLCAEMAARLEPCRALVWYAAYAQDAVPEEAALMACHAKSHLAEVGTFVARTSTEVHGGMGFTDLLGLHYWFKRIGANRQLLGNPEAVRAEAAALQD